MTKREDMANNCKEAMDIMAKAGVSMTQACGEIGQHIMALPHKAIAAHLSVGQEALNVKSLNDFVDLHARWAGDMVNVGVAHAVELSRLAEKMAHEIGDPLKAHWQAFHEKDKA